ncbi:FAD-dependent monooxygenase [Pleurocapsales cyanobacterium LEGE 06147]|nr:FAD-dependent monooxygenase [Pleurocapsales cyanobacterium LEGE 06147]
MLNKTEVLIVGAGPTGLTTAIELARRNINVRIIERRTQPSIRSKALVVHARTLELMDILGIANEMVRRGYTSPGIDFSSNAEKPLRASMYGLDTRFPFILILPQAETEAILERRLNDLGIEVERGRTLTSFTKTDEGICGIVECTEGDTFEINARYLVGADGAKSVVRKTLDLSFEGSSYSWTALLGDVQLQGHHAEGGTEQHSNNRGLAFIVPFDDGSHRIVTIDRNYQSTRHTRKLKLEDLQESISAILEKPVELSDPKWLTRWGASLRLAPQYRVGRVFLGGDAVHIHSPAGGQGLNTGVQDAFNLGWKLALAIEGTAPEAILNTYNAERHAIGKKVLRTSDLLLKSLLLHQPLLRQLRTILFQLLIPLPPIQRNLALNLSGLGISYQTGKGDLAGKRIPDMEFMTAKHELVRLYQLLSFPGYTLLLFIDPNQARQERDKIDRLIGYADNRLKPQIILNNGLPALHNFQANTLVDYRGDLETKLGAKTGRVILIRPDGYVASDLSTLDPEAFAEQLPSWKTRKIASSKALVA